ncbi:MAG: DegT/DnrJ/EryC1/StrS family aminotransferase [Candidatus Omnitrophica bacterium]|nr:DegT/DnrJ/EryC1/StrS family aminotransferase [Candidatus Omnitrophota bacterium]MDD5310562.1 DegT/DnrJ/EryC1/StrS family aminotransferase [Candidatus Omnitrophota bacterium]
MSCLALTGGKPVRKKPFHNSVVIDGDEWRYVREVMKNKELSRFMGSPTRDIGKLLVMPSKDALNYRGQYFSFLGGKMVRRFEADFAGKLKVKYAVSVNSATSGLSTALGAAGIGPGDEVITTCLSFNATALSILMFNSIPVFVDVDPKNFCLDPRCVEKAVTKRTKAILAVHLLGNPADMDAILRIARKHRLAIIEDCAQAPGTKYKNRFVGTIGDLGVFSFQETKNITTGEGGMVITNDPGLARKARLIRNHGESVPDISWDEGSLSNIVGMNFRMTELTAAVGIAQLKKLDRNNSERLRNYRSLSKGLKGLPGLSAVELQEGVIPHVFPLIYDKAKTGVERAKVLAALKAEGIPAGSGYLKTMYDNPIFLRKIAFGKGHCPWSCHLYKAKREYKRGDCPVAEDLIKEKFIWFYHINRPNGRDDMRDVVAAFKKVFGNLAELRGRSVKTDLGYKW